MRCDTAEYFDPKYLLIGQAQPTQRMVYCHFERQWLRPVCKNLQDAGACFQFSPADFIFIQIAKKTPKYIYDPDEIGQVGHIVWHFQPAKSNPKKQVLARISNSNIADFIEGVKLSANIRGRSSKRGLVIEFKKDTLKCTEFHC